MRGKVNPRYLFPLRAGITPAYAGKSLTKPTSPQSTPDHPRLCGEKAACLPVIRTHSGSPPPMRGKATAAARTACLPRITPAYAGKSHRWNVSQEQGRDHPRLCGEKQPDCSVGYASWGSPPPMRGKVPLFSFFSKFDRITPAYAGKSPHCRSLHCRIQDHPRLCGEKCVVAGR